MGWRIRSTVESTFAEAPGPFIETEKGEPPSWHLNTCNNPVASLEERGHRPPPPGMAVALVCVCRLGLGPTRSDGFPMHKLNHATTGPSLHRVELPPIRLSHCDIYYALDFSSLLAHTLSVHDSTAFIPPVAPHSNHTPCA